MPPSSRGPEVRGRTRWSYHREVRRCPSAASRTTAITVAPPRTPPGESPSTTSTAPDTILGESTNLRLVRLRLFLALVTMFAIPIAIAAPVIYGLAWGFGTSLVVPTARPAAPRGHPRHAHALAGAARPGAGRAARAGPAHPRGRLRPGSRRVAARRPDRPRQPPRLPGGDRAPVGGRDPARPAAGPGDRRSRRLQADQRRAGHAAGDRCCARRRRSWRRTCAAPTGPSGSVATSSRSSWPGPTRRTPGSTIRRLLAACLDGEKDGRDPTAVSFSAGISELSPHARDRDALYSEAEAALLWSKRHGRTCVTVYDPEQHDAPTAGATDAELSALVARVAATGAIRAVFQPIYDLRAGAARVRGPGPAAARQRLRRSEPRCSPPPRPPGGRSSSTSPA